MTHKKVFTSLSCQIVKYGFVESIFDKLFYDFEEKGRLDNQNQRYPLQIDSNDIK